MTKNTTYGVSQLSKLAGISVRTLHHYDAIGLLKPSRRKDNGYREYDQTQLILLQQILIYRELDFNTEAIKQMLISKEDKLLSALQKQKDLLLTKQENLQSMVKSIEVSMSSLNEQRNVQALYSGIPKEKAENWDQQARILYAEKAINDSYQRVGKLSLEELAEVKEQGKRVGINIAALLDKSVTCDEVQAVVKQHHAWINNFYTPSFEIYRGLALMYVDSDEFSEFYDKCGKGTAKHLSEAMVYFAEQNLKGE